MTWLGQAPGPGATGQGLGDQLVEIADGATTLDYWDSEATNCFNQSWAGHWNVDDSAKPKSPKDTDVATTASQKVSSKRLSTGTKAGIGIGAVFAGLAVLVTVVLWRRRKHHDKIAPSNFFHEAGQHSYGSPMPL